ncbi:MAG: RsmD family RNA methyltransferase [Bacteroidetes bacterium]|nr:RsmD family RNA methyltransferase [Bacteroidota bacterium]
MRIISGTFKGRNLIAPGNLPVRPTTDFAKSGLFNILNNYFDFENLTVLDLCCGIGSITFEFASRGAKQIICVDEHIGCLNFIRATSEKLGMAGISTVKADLFKYIEQEGKKYDIIFADPPFESAETDRLPDLILEKKLLNEGGWLIVEHQSKRILKSNAQPFQVRKYGNCTFSIYTSVNS